MPHILKNKNLEIQIDTPFENYNFSRFDWTGKIVGVKFQDTQLACFENTDNQNEHFSGKGFYNEFGIDNALGFDETDIGDWFHKIGVGSLKKEDSHYQFSAAYEIKPAQFETVCEEHKIVIVCKSETINGRSYILSKEIELHENSFIIKYFLENTGEKDIVTNEYAHNFLAFNASKSTNYILNFPFQLNPELFGEAVNPELKVTIGKNEIKFNGTSKKQFFFSNLTGGARVAAEWELLNLESKVGLRETGNFLTNKVNLWGWEHVISPELFKEISIKPGETTNWFRKYEVYQLK
tara:strand:- start:3928 stop:4809 length:882 start_codon:yes stop_codon:yes gene_type:complete